MTFATDESTHMITGSRLHVDPSAEQAAPGTYPVRLVWSLQEFSVEADFEIEFFLQISCVEALIQFKGKDIF